MIPSPSARRATVSGQKVEPITRGSEMTILPFHFGASRSLTLRSSSTFTWSTFTNTPSERTRVNAYESLSRSRKPASKPPRQLASLRASGTTMTGRIGSHTPLCFITCSAVLVGMVATSQV